jgi:tetratricopeptide (TPR) repeat protein
VPLAVDGDPAASVRLALDWSYQRLTSAAQRLFRLLGLTPGPDVTVDAAAAITGMSPNATAESLRALADAHLLEPLPGRRYGMHDLLKAYAAERASDADSLGDRDAAVRRLLDWYLRATVAAVDLLYPLVVRLTDPMPLRATASGSSTAPWVAVHPTKETALAWLTAERRNLVAALTSAAAGDRPEYAWLIGDALRGYFDGTGHPVDWMNVAEAGVAAAALAGDPRARASAATNLAHVHGFRGNIAVAITYATQALALSAESGWVEGEARALNHLGFLHAAAARPAAAFEAFAKALVLDRVAGEESGLAMRLGNLGALCMSLGRLDESATYLRAALDIHRRNRFPERTVLGNLGIVYQRWGAFDAARRCLSRSLAGKNQPVDRHTEVHGLSGLSLVERERGRTADARRFADAAMGLAADVNPPHIVSLAANALAVADLALGDATSAVTRYETTLGLVEDDKFAVQRVVALIGLADALCDRGNLDAAGRRADEAIRLAAAGGYQIFAGQAHALRAQIVLNRHGGHRLSAARAHGEEALALQRRTGHRVGEVRTLTILAAIAAAGGAPGRAARLRRASTHLAARLGIPEAAAAR